ncbi:agmatine deiminase [Salibacterium sp. K-3]
MKKSDTAAGEYWMPAEFEPHEGTWLLWPWRTDTWRAGAKPAQLVFKNVAEAVAAYEPVTVCVPREQYEHARALLSEDVRVVEMSSNDAWMRDIGPIFVKKEDGEKRGVDFGFNAWGGLNGGLYFPWDQDELVPRKVLDLERIKRHDSRDLVLEGGSVAVDGEGTLITTKECLLHPNRNPDWTMGEIEERLKETLGVTKVIWLDNGLVGDETDGHVDEVLCYAGPGEVILSWTDDPEDPQYDVLHQCRETLENEVDAQGRTFTIHHVPMPEQPYLTEEETLQIDQTDDSYERLAEEPCIASYVNCYLCNGAVVVPAFHDSMDEKAVQLFTGIFPDRAVVPVYTRELSLAGGNIHCITQQQPK